MRQTAVDSNKKPQRCWGWRNIIFYNLLVTIGDVIKQPDGVIVRIELMGCFFEFHNRIEIIGSSQAKFVPMSFAIQSGESDVSHKTKLQIIGIERCC